MTEAAATTRSVVFRPEDEGFYQGAGFGWKKMVESLERIVVGLH